MKECDQVLPLLACFELVTFSSFSPTNSYFRYSHTRQPKLSLCSVLMHLKQT